MTQTEEIREHLEKYGPITWLVAYREYGCSRLPARIYDLKRQGMKIEKTMEPYTNRRGQKKYHAVYRMVQDG